MKTKAELIFRDLPWCIFVFRDLPWCILSFVISPGVFLSFVISPGDLLISKTLDFGRRNYSSGLLGEFDWFSQIPNTFHTALPLVLFFRSLARRVLG